ncbi:MAG TPA: hypothetical protein VJ865_15320 [Gemmatimonadaceae bacterium]|nr:hypothetical protein [Gemmatimonadaceae bacterium]
MVTVQQRRIFLLSPASCGGKRAALLFNDRAEFDIAVRVRSQPGAALGDVFSFLSGLYFRGKLAYARAFTNPPPRKAPGIQIITPTDGLYSPGSLVTLKDLERFATVAIDAEDSRYRYPLERDAGKIADRIGPKCEVVLLGSVASGKYVDVLLPIFGKRLVFPKEFIGHGDMARGGMLLQRADSGKELTYIPVADPARLGVTASKKVRAEAAARYEAMA